MRIERWGGPARSRAACGCVEPAAFTKVSALGVEEQRVNVLIDITSPREQWRALGDGYRVSVRIVTLSMPHGAAGAGERGVPAAPRTAAARRCSCSTAVARGWPPVELGARNGTDAWVQGGLADGATVIVYPPAAVRDGVRVKPRSV